MKDTLQRVYTAIRRRYLYYCRPGYVKQSIAKKKGKCNMCPCCTYTLWGLFRKDGGCKHLKDNKCELFGTPDFPTFCRIYPIDEKDKTPFAKKHCGFYWD